MREEIKQFISEKREQLTRDGEFQQDHDPNDYAALGAICGGLDMLKDLAVRFDVVWEE